MRELVEDNRAAINVGRVERITCGLVGAWMLVRGLRQRSKAGMALSGGGALLACRAVTGRSWLYRQLHVSGSSRGRRSEAAVPYQTGFRVQHSVIVARQPEELYRFWRNPQNLPLFMDRIEKVTPTGTNRSHWVAKGPSGAAAEWDEEIVNDRPGELIGWQSSGSRHGHAGSVVFTPLENGRGSEVKLTLEYRPCGGPLGGVLSALLGRSPGRRIAGDLQRFKQLMEADVAGRLYGPEQK